MNTGEFAREHRRLADCLAAGRMEEFHSGLRAHLRQEERAIFRWLRPLLDVTAPPWLDRRLTVEELLAASNQAEAEPLLARLVRVEEEELFPLARALDRDQ